MAKHTRDKWVPKPGIYQCVVPSGTIHIDVYLDGRTPEPLALSFGDEVELWERELRTLRNSRIIQDGFLAPIEYFVSKEDGSDGYETVEAEEDCGNPNVISDDNIMIKVQSFSDSKKFKDHIDTITSKLTLDRFRSACKQLDTAQSYIDAIDSQMEAVEKLEREDMYAGPIDERRQNFLKGKITRE